VSNVRISTDEKLWIHRIVEPHRSSDNERQWPEWCVQNDYANFTPNIAFHSKTGIRGDYAQPMQWYCKITNLRINSRWNHLRASQQCEMCHEAQDLQ
jgi:hypothetical protein